ncbi:MAG TPA: hypothetical protein VLA56_05525 [Pseudomonadales bacterium]|nr:hypothetical protein [Pseudomonadales bacterium]
MSIFEFILIPFGLVVAFAVSELMSSWARILRDRASWTNPGLYLSFSIWLVLNLFGHFAGLWSYRDLAFSTGTAILTLMPAFLFALAMTLFALDPRSEDRDLAAAYERVIRPVALLVAAGLFLSTATDLLPGVAETPPFVVMGAQLLLMLILAFASSRRVHVGAHVALWVGNLTFPLFAYNPL